MTEYTEDKSRTNIKKEASDLQKLGERLVSLTNEQLSGIDIPDELKEAVRASKTIGSNKAKRRQKQFIGALMRQIDPEPVHKALQAIDGGLSLKSKKTSRTKAWCEEFIAGNDSLIDTIVSEFPGADR